MPIQTSITNTEKLGSVLVKQTSLLADMADLDVTTVDVSLAKTVMSLEVINGSDSDIYFKFYDARTVTLSTAVAANKVRVASGTTQFIGTSLGLVFNTAITVAASTSAGPDGSPTAYSGTVSYTLIAKA
jgi:hypothetical protein|tara:strand:- start:148 stop:534 length:387 start_codon:yes stop_codon:yes gene_type:complete